jgi:hypothetical protein
MFQMEGQQWNHKYVDTLHQVSIGNYTPMETGKQGRQIMKRFADNFIPVLRPGYPVIFEHTPKTPFCPDPSCPCHEQDKEAIALVNQYYQEGLITKKHATDIVMGRMPL